MSRPADLAAGLAASHPRQPPASHAMKSPLIPALLLACLAHPGLSQSQPDLTNPKARRSYALGMDIVSTLRQQGADVDARALAAGIADTFAGKSVLTQDQQKAALDSLSQSMAANLAARRKIIAAQNLQAGQAFLAANARQPGVQILRLTAPDGAPAELQYLILKSGAGPSPQKDDIVNVNYVGSLIDGTVFDTSLKHHMAATFALREVIPGWSAALQRMKAGDKWRLFIPSALGYGESGAPQIPPDSVTIYDVELLGFRAPGQPGSAAVNPPGAPAK